MDLDRETLRQLRIRGPKPEALGISLLGDNMLAAEDLEFWKDENYKGHGWFSMRPHCRVRRIGEGYGLDEALYITNFSRQGATLGELGLETWKSDWVKNMQLITILQVGPEDLFRGPVPKEEFKRNGKMILTMVRRAILNMVDIKTKYLQRIAPKKLEFWKRKHHFGIYSLPNLESYPFEGTGWTFEEYVTVSRQQNNYLKQSRDKEHLKYSVLSPHIKTPIFSYRKKGNFKGFSYVKLEENLMKPFVEPIMRLVGKRFCSRCREPSLREGLWKDRLVIPADGKPNIVHYLPPEIWREIFKWLTVFDVWTMKETCKGIYKIHHKSLRCVRSFILREEEESAEEN